MSWLSQTARAMLVLLPALSAASDLETRATAILSARCLGCHNPDQKIAGLVLTSREYAVTGGKSGAALTPGKPDESLLLKKLAAGEMPPGNPLPEADRQTIREWIQAGAPWSAALEFARKRAGPDWWSLQPLGGAEPPSPAGMPAAWTQSPIDRFIYAKLREKHLAPSPPADRATYIRRATFDLLGLPPTPQEIDAFVADPAPDAYEKLIDRLLASPHYGERWGRHWLDVIRFGESHGYEQNHLREHAWPFRDYIIRSFNQDKPFNRLIVEHLAGDQLAPDNPDVEVGTGFLVAGVHDTVGIANEEGSRLQRANDLDDMVLATGAAFLGLTVNCARCHNHKFDPIQQADYYRLQAAFAGVEHSERALASQAAKQDREAAEKPLTDALAKVMQELADLKQRLQPEVDRQRAAIVSQYRPPIDAKGTEETFAPRDARLVRMTILATTGKSEPAIDEFEIWTDGAAGQNVALASRGAKVTARSTRTTGGDVTFYLPENLIDGKFDKQWISGEPGKGRITIELARTERIARIVWSRDRLGANQGNFLGQVATSYVIEASLDGQQWQTIAASEGRLPYGEKEREEFFLLAVAADAEKQQWSEGQRQKAALEQQIAALPALPRAYIGKFKQPAEPLHLNKRGNPMDLGEVIAPASLSTLSNLLPGFALEATAPEGARRLALARWIADDRNALTARVLANRVWHYHFGKGLVGTPSDFGFNGERPTHPELLDWLARRLHEYHWQLKPLHRELMLSAVYRQSSVNSEAGAAQDSDARYLWRFPPRRLEAEAVRDSVLAVSGKLDLTAGGPGFRLFKYTVDNVATYYPLEQFGAETYRRAVYQQAARSVKDDMLGPYDCPDSALPEPKRWVTTTALQALSMMNSSFIIDQARFFAERLVRETGPDHGAQVDRAYRLAFGRIPKPEERAAAIHLIEQHGLVIFCRALFNANEFVYVM